MKLLAILLSHMTGKKHMIGSQTDTEILWDLAETPQDLGCTDGMIKQYWK